jgi:hypothetical protein
MITDEVLRAQLVLAIENSAKWRARRVERYRDAKSNIGLSRSLAALAKRLEALPINNPHLAAYVEIMERAATVAKRSMRDDISKIESQCIGRYGCHYPQEGNPAPFLFVLTREITDLVEEEERIRARRGITRLPRGNERERPKRP